MDGRRTKGMEEERRRKSFPFLSAFRAQHNGNVCPEKDKPRASGQNSMRKEEEKEEELDNFQSLRCDGISLEEEEA